MKEARLITIDKYTGKWKLLFAEEKEKIEAILKEKVNAIYHIGSTSIPGMASKPIVDILVEVDNIQEMDNYEKDFEPIGYRAFGEYGISGRRFFVKGEGLRRCCHIHFYESGNLHICNHLLFRGYLMRHPDEAKRYMELKIESAKKYSTDIKGYSQGKDKLIKEILHKANVSEDKERLVDGIVSACFASSTSKGASIRLIDYGERKILYAMLQLYLKELSSYADLVADEYGRYGYAYLENYWLERGRVPLFIYKNNIIIGFVFLRINVDNHCHEVAEVFIKKEHRKNGYAIDVIRRLISGLPGMWKISMYKKNKIGRSFWASTAAAISQEYQWEQGNEEGREGEKNTLNIFVKE